MAQPNQLIYSDKKLAEWLWYLIFTGEAHWAIQRQLLQQLENQVGQTIGNWCVELLSWLCQNLKFFLQKIKKLWGGVYLLYSTCQMGDEVLETGSGVWSGLWTLPSMRVYCPLRTSRSHCSSSGRLAKYETGDVLQIAKNYLWSIITRHEAMERYWEGYSVLCG